MEFDPLCARHTRWEALPSALDARRKLTFTLVLKAQNMARIRDIVSSVSDPASVRYGRYLSQEQIDKITDPAASTSTRCAPGLLKRTCLTAE